MNWRGNGSRLKLGVERTPLLPEAFSEPRFVENILICLNKGASEASVLHD